MRLNNMYDLTKELPGVFMPSLPLDIIHLNRRGKLTRDIIPIYKVETFRKIGRVVHENYVWLLDSKTISLSFKEISNDL